MIGIRKFFSGIFCFLLVSVLSLLGLVTTLNLTVLNPDFMVAEIKQLGIYSQLASQLESFLQGQGISERDAEITLSGLEPELKQEIEEVIRNIYSSIGKGGTETTIYLDGIRQIIKDYATRALSLSPELQGAPTGEMEAVISRIYSEIDGMVPETIVLSDYIPGAEALPQLSLIRQVPAYLQTLQRVLIIPAVVLVLLVCLVHWWQPRPIAQALGVVFITVGVGCVVVSLFGSLGNVLLGFLAVPHGAYSQFQSSIFQLFSDILKPMRMYGFGFASAGICLVIVSLLWRTTPSDVQTMLDQASGQV